MISSGHFRPSFQITIADIFQDYNDPRKEALSQRVQLALEEQERRLKHELETNNLSNLQILLKKQQILKKMEQTINEKNEQIDELTHKIEYSNIKITQLQKELSRYHQISKISDQKLNSLTGSLKQLQSIVKSKESLHINLQKQKQNLIGQNERLEEEKKKYQQLISNLRQSYNKKVEESQYVLKIRQKKMKDQFQENLEQFKNKKEIEKMNREIQNKVTKNQKQSKNQRVQCNLIAKESPRKPEPQKQDDSTQTEDTQDRSISDLIDKNKQSSQIKPNLDEIRLIYINDPLREIPLAEPKLTKYFSLVREDKQIQTQETQSPNQSPLPLLPSPSERHNKDIQVNLYVQDKSLKQKLRKQKQNSQVIRSEYNKMSQQVKFLKRQNSEIKICIQNLNLRILQLELDLQKKGHAMAVERQTLTRTNQQLEKSQNELMIRKFSGRTDLTSRKPVFSKTCSILYPKQEHQTPLNESKQIQLIRSTQQESKYKQDDDAIVEGGGLDSVQFLSPRKWAEEESEVITIIRKANNLKFFKTKRHSVTQQNQPRSTSISGSPFIKRNYRKYSQAKKF